MIGRTALALLFVCAPLSVAEAQDTPAATAPTAEETALAAFDPLIGKAWRGVSINVDAIVDELRFERTAGGKAIRSTHSAAGGAYVGDTLIAWDPDATGLASFYATSGGFYTTGTIKVLGPGTFEFEQDVHGLNGIESVRAQTTFTDGVYRIRSQHHINGVWIETGGFDYRAEP